MCVCERCGAAIKNVYTFQGRNYGVECVTIVSGIRKAEIESMQDGNIDQHLVNKAERLAKLEAEQEAYNTKQEELKATYATKNEFLINLLIKEDHHERFNSNTGEWVTIHKPAFHTSLAEQLEVKSLDDLSDKQINAIFEVLEGYKLPALKGFAKQLNITLQPKSKKDDVIEAIVNNF